MPAPQGATLLEEMKPLVPQGATPLPTIGISPVEDEVFSGEKKVEENVRLAPARFWQ